MSLLCISFPLARAIDIVTDEDDYHLPPMTIFCCRRTTTVTTKLRSGHDENGPNDARRVVWAISQSVCVSFFRVFLYAN